MHAAGSRMKGMKSFQQKGPVRFFTAQALSVYHKAAASAVFPVSYTHLDVYKRQVRDAGAERPCAVRGGRLRAESGGPGVSSPK